MVDKLDLMQPVKEIDLRVDQEVSVEQVDMVTDKVEDKEVSETITVGQDHLWL